MRDTYPYWAGLDRGLRRVRGHIPLWPYVNRCRLRRVRGMFLSPFGSDASESNSFRRRYRGPRRVRAYMYMLYAGWAWTGLDIPVLFGMPLQIGRTGDMSILSEMM